MIMGDSQLGLPVVRPRCQPPLRLREDWRLLHLPVAFPAGERESPRHRVGYLVRHRPAVVAVAREAVAVEVAAPIERAMRLSCHLDEADD